MPDFPSPAGGGATAAEVWAYATRGLSTPGDYKADVTNLDVAVSTRAPEAGGNLAAVKGKTDNLPALPAPANEYDAELDAAISTRAPSGEYNTEMAHLDVDVSSRSSHAPGAIWAEATRTLTALTGTPRTDLIGEDASFEAATGRPAKILRLDNIPAYESPVEASILMDGSEQVLVSKEDDKIGVLDGYVDLTTMAADDVIVIRQSMQVKAAGAYVKYAEETYSGPQTIPLLHIVTKTAKDKIKVTAEQTGIGTYRTLDVQFYRRLQA